MTERKLTAKQKRTEIKRILALLEDKHRHTFKLMYSHLDTTKDINLVVDDMPAKQLSWALAQCEETYHNIFKILKYA
jgi:phage anti-repressor protein